MAFGLGAGMTPWVQRLIAANIVMFVLQQLSKGLVTYVLQFVPELILRQPWTLVTYMFLHGGFGHLFFNMLALYFFGPAVEGRFGSREFIKYYLICGIGGAALSFVFASNPIIGASAAVYGVMLAFAMNWPDTPIYIWAIFPVPAKVLVMVMAAISLYSGLTNSGGNVAHFAHLGGFAAGWLYLKLDRRGGGLFTRAKRAMAKNRLDVVQGGGASPSRPPEQMLDDLDRILDKISKQGMNSLTFEERRLLDEASRRRQH